MTNTADLAHLCGDGFRIFILPCPSHGNDRAHLVLCHREKAAWVDVTIHTKELHRDPADFYRRYLAPGVARLNVSI